MARLLEMVVKPSQHEYFSFFGLMVFAFGIVLAARFNTALTFSSHLVNSLTISDCRYYSGMAF